MKKILLILFFFCSSNTYTQNVVTKFKQNGNLISEPGKISNKVWEFKKGDKAYVSDYFGENWWLLQSPNGFGFTHSAYIKVTSELERLIENKPIKELEERKNKIIKDSILLIEKKRRDSILIRRDSIEKAKMVLRYGYDIFNRQSVLENISRYASDSLLVIYVPINTKVSPEPNYSNNKTYRLTISKKIVVLDYKQNFFRVLINSKEEYIGYLFFNKYGVGAIKYEFENEFLAELYNIKRINEKIAKKKSDEERSRKNEAIRKYKEAQYVSKFGYNKYNRIKRGEVWIGMTKEMAQIGGWYPGSSNVNRTVNRYGISEQWVCRNGVYLYFDDDILTAWQD